MLGKRRSVSVDSAWLVKLFWMSLVDPDINRRHRCKSGFFQLKIKRTLLENQQAFVEISSLLFEIRRSLSDVGNNDVAVCEITFCTVVGLIVFVSGVRIYLGRYPQNTSDYRGFSLRLQSYSICFCVWFTNQDCTLQVISSLHLADHYFSPAVCGFPSLSPQVIN